MLKYFFTVPGTSYKIKFKLNTRGWPMLYVCDSINHDTLAKSRDILPPGEYEYTFTAAGYSTQVRFHEIVLTNNDISLLYFKLEEVEKRDAVAFGFNGKLKDDEIYGDGNEYDYGFRIYNSRLGRFLSVDPLSLNYPMLTPYQFSSNNPIRFIDLDGLEAIPPEAAEHSGSTTITAFTSSKVTDALKDAKQHFMKVFFVKPALKLGVKVGGGLLFGPISVEGTLNVVKAGGTVSANEANIEASALGFEGEASFGPAKASGSASAFNGELKVKEPLSENREFEASDKGGDYDGDVKVDNGGYSADNSGKFGLTVNVLGIKLTAGINLGHFGLGIASLVKAAVEFTKEKANGHPYPNAHAYPIQEESKSEFPKTPN